MGEVLKTALIRDESFYGWVIVHMTEINDRVYPVLVKMIQKCCDIKRKIVEADPDEKGERAVLNLGHTIGHAMDSVSLWVLWRRPTYPLSEEISPQRNFMRSAI